MRMLEANRREIVGKTLMDFAKVLFGAMLASGFFAAFPKQIQFALLALLVILFVAGWWFAPPGK